MAGLLLTRLSLAFGRRPSGARSGRRAAPAGAGRGAEGTRAARRTVAHERGDGAAGGERCSAADARGGGEAGGPVKGQGGRAEGADEAQQLASF